MLSKMIHCQDINSPTNAKLVATILIATILDLQATIQTCCLSKRLFEEFLIYAHILLFL